MDDAQQSHRINIGNITYIYIISTYTIAKY